MLSLKTAATIVLALAALSGCGADPTDEPADAATPLVDTGTVLIDTGPHDAGEPAISASDAADACAAFVACEAEWPTDLMDACLRSVLGGERGTRLAMPTAPDVACVLAAAGDCAQLRACLGWSIERRDACTDACSGDTLIACRRTPGGVYEERVSCARTGPGNACVEVRGAPTDGGVPSFPACSTELCPEASLVCEGDDAAYCPWRPRSVRWIQRCGAGTACVLDYTEGYAGCRGIGAPCTEGSCEGSVATGCAGGRLVPPIDCAEQGLECVSGSCSARLPGADCESPRLRCEGDELRYCRAGEIHRIDCVALGLAGCAVLSVSGVESATCVPAGGRLD